MIKSEPSGKRPPREDRKREKSPSSSSSSSDDAIYINKNAQEIVEACKRKEKEEELRKKADAEKDLDNPDKAEDEMKRLFGIADFDTTKVCWRERLYRVGKEA